MVVVLKQAHGTNEDNMLELSWSGVFPENSSSGIPQQDVSAEDHIFYGDKGRGCIL